MSKAEEYRKLADEAKKRAKSATDAAAREMYEQLARIGTCSQNRWIANAANIKPTNHGRTFSFDIPFVQTASERLGILDSMTQ